jgi:hypothetical protein
MSSTGEMGTQEGAVLDGVRGEAGTELVAMGESSVCFNSADSHSCSPQLSPSLLDLKFFQKNF